MIGKKEVPHSRPSAGSVRRRGLARPDQHGDRRGAGQDRHLAGAAAGPVYPLVFFDALRVKIRDEGLARNKAVHIALGVRADGTKQILGLWLEPTEGAKLWLCVMNELRNRDGEDVLLAVVDGLKGFPQAILAVFPEATVQTCIVHLLRHSLNFVSWKDRKPVAEALKDIYRARGCRGGRSRPGGVRGRPLGSEIRRHLPELAPCLGESGAVLCLSHRDQAAALHRGLDRRMRSTRLFLPRALILLLHG